MINNYRKLKVKQMQEKQKQPPYRITVLDHTHLDKSSHQEHPHIRSSASYPHKQQPTSSPSRKPHQSAEKCCSFPESFRRQMLRMIFIPLLIVLFLLTIALTFKQNNYQTNDYFYSKNIEINRKIRGVVPPLNETKQDIFGEYKIGLVQKFNIENRRIFEDWKVELWKNQSMRVTQTGNNNQCWAIYKLKFYSSTIFISRIQNHIYVEGSSSPLTRKLQNYTQENTNEKVVVDDINEASGQITDKNLTPNAPQSNQDNQTESTHHASTPNSTLQNTTKPDPENNLDTPNSICSVDLWAKLNQILYESHIWTFAQDNFYLLEFSQLGDDRNGVLILKLLQKYLNPV